MGVLSRQPPPPLELLRHLVRSEEEQQRTKDPRCEPATPGLSGQCWLKQVLGSQSRGVPCPCARSVSWTLTFLWHCSAQGRAGGSQGWLSPSGDPIHPGDLCVAVRRGGPEEASRLWHLAMLLTDGASQ